ncbi:MAG: hypothetical protein VYB65_02955 [Myxococcota bacterium]|nr:hypothetical protein [Myxococcota bacterium]
MRFEELQAVLTTDELLAFGLMPIPVALPANDPSCDLQHRIEELPTADLSPAL